MQEWLFSKLCCRARLRNLNQAENEKYTTIGEKYKGFVNKAQDYNNTQPALSSPDVDWVEYDADAFDRKFLDTGSARLMALATAMIETKRMHDYDNFQNALIDKKYAVYKSDTSPGLGYDAKAAAYAEFFTP
jgi:hypothetical protein